MADSAEAAPGWRLPLGRVMEKVREEESGVSGGTGVAGGSPEVFFEEFTEMIGVFIADHGGDGLDA